MPEKSYVWMLWVLALVGLASDQTSKYGVFRWLYDAQRPQSKYEYEVVPGAFMILAQFTNQRDPGDHVLSPLRTWSAESLPRVNKGALFGLGGEYDEVVVVAGYRVGANAIFTAVSLLAAVAILYWSTLKSTVRDRILCPALGLILAGTLGNLYDRLIFGGVRDFFYFYWFEWPVFNVADCCLVCGAGLLLLQAFLTRAPVEQTVSAANASRELVQAK